MSKCIWIAWERQRRSVELSKALNAELFILNYDGYLRYIKCLVSTFFIVKRSRPEVLIVQNPSMILTLFSTLVLKKYFRVPVIVDRHSNFLLFEENISVIKRIVFSFLSNLTLCMADITIVTNEPLSDLVKISGGTPFILPDKLPCIIPPSDKSSLCEGKKTLFLISSFGKDERFDIIWEAIEKTQVKDLIVYVSGNFNKLPPNLISSKPENVIFTGFIPDDEFDGLLSSVDAVMVLTNADYILLCGCYEAVSAEKPLITSKTKVLQNLFRNVQHANLTPDSISDKIKICFSDLQKNKMSTIRLKESMSKKWDIEFSKLLKSISKLNQSDC